jgi:hypothetical protein
MPIIGAFPGSPGASRFIHQLAGTLYRVGWIPLHCWWHTNNKAFCLWYHAFNLVLVINNIHLLLRLTLCFNYIYTFNLVYIINTTRLYYCGWHSITRNVTCKINSTLCFRQSWRHVLVKFTKYVVRASHRHKASVRVDFRRNYYLQFRRRVKTPIAWNYYYFLKPFNCWSREYPG